VQNCREEGLLIAVASSVDAIKVRANLEKIGLPIKFWDAVATAEDVKNKKPAPDIFLSAAAKLGVTPQECVVVEEAVNGVQAAKAAGMRCVSVSTSFPADRLRGADLVKARMLDVLLSDLAPHLYNG
jgi:beta-phosphoglucomutase-like phosphatase (HAD superfamily)